MTTTRRPVVQRTNWAEEFKPKNLVPGVAAGILVGLTIAIIAVSFSSLIFSGPYGEFQARGIGLGLVSAVIITIPVAILSRIPGAIGSVQEGPTIILALMAVHLAEHFDVEHTAQKLPTLLVALAIATFITGLLLFLMGHYKLGKLVRFIPFPVVAGFLAGGGWLLVVGSIGTMADYPLTLANIPALLEPDQLILWLPGVAIALILFFGLRLIKHPLGLPGLLVGMIPIFFVGLLIAGLSLDEAIDMGLLLGLGADVGWQPITPAVLGEVDWSILIGEAWHIPVAYALTTVALLLNLQGIETGMDLDIDPNTELRITGGVNLFIGLMGGLVSFHSVSITSLNNRIGQRSRITGVLVGIVCLVILLFGASVLDYFPKPLLGGILLFLGMDFLNEWLISAAPRFSRAELLTVVAIVAVIGFVDFLVGVGVGLVLMVIIFVMEYSRLESVRHELSGREIHSKVQRSTRERRVLSDHGDRILVLELQGLIFFGTAHALLERVTERLNAESMPDLEFALLDFARVKGLDSSAVLSFTKMQQLAESYGFTLILTNVEEALRTRLSNGGLVEEDENVVFMPDLDHGLEVSEEALIARELGADTVGGRLEDQFRNEAFPDEHIPALMTYMDRRELADHDYLIREGDTADDMFIIESGRVSVYLELDDGDHLRLRTTGPGTVVGELGLYLGSTRTASVIADEPSVVYRLTREDLDQMKVDHPALALAFSEFLTVMLGERLVDLSATIEAMHP